MRPILLTLLASSLLLSGCASLFAEPTTAMENVGAFDAAAEQHLSQPIFMGLVGVEGSIDLDRLERMVKEEIEEEGEDPAIFDKFDFRYQNGELGDGRVGSWFAAYGDDDDWDKALILQNTPSGMNHHLFEFGEEEMEAEDEWEGTAFLSIVDRLMPQRHSQEFTCDDEDMSTSIPDGIDSDRAAAIAMDQPEFRNHTETIDGDFLYAYMPSFQYCWDGEVDEDPAMWLVAHVDIDEFLDDDDIEPSIAYVVMDHEGNVMESDIEVPVDLVHFQTTLEVQAGLLPAPLASPAEGSVEFDVPANTDSLDGYFFGDSMDLRLIDANGDEVTLMDFGGPDRYAWIQEPVAGTWTLHGSFEGGLQETRSVDVSIYMWVPQDNAES